VTSVLKDINGLYFFVKEAAAIRGIPDIIICYHGRFIAWELKRSQKVAESWRDGHELQKYNIKKINESGGIARIVYPENFQECLDELMSL
jgi:penicillin-binding protein-related factor A (putative recombinase)